MSGSTRPYKPEHKGKIENGIGYLKNNALKGRRFLSLQALNEHLRDWEQNVADKRIHGTTRRHVGTHFEEVEKVALQKLPAELFASFQEGKRSVHRDACLKVCHAFYHVPVEYIGAQFWVRWDAAMVRIYNHKMEHIISHASLEPGQFTQVLGVEGCRGSIEESVRYYRGRVAIYGEPCARWADLVISENPQGAIRLMQGLLSLTDKYECSHLQEACRKAVIHGHYRLRQLRNWLSSPHEQETFSFLEQHEIIRQTQIYGDYSGASHLFNSN